MIVHKRLIRPNDLKVGEVKVVMYSKGNIVLLVPDPAWDMKGDLTRVPAEKRKILQSPRKNGVKRSQLVIDEGTRNGPVPSGKTILDDIGRKGYFESDRGVQLAEHYAEIFKV